MIADAPTQQIEDIYVLSPTQMGMLFHGLDAPGARFYLEQFHCVLEGNLDVDAFLRAWRTLTDRHSVLRASMIWEGLDQPVQAIHRAVDIPVTRQDWTDVPVGSQDARLRAFLEADAARGLDFAQAPLMRLALFRLAVDRCYFVWTYHHLLLDGWSTVLALKEALYLYESYARREEPALPRPRPFRDYIEWLSRRNMHEAERYWRERLQGCGNLLPLPGDRLHPGAQSRGRREVERTTFDPDLSAALRDFARTHRITLSTCMQAIWSWLLGRAAHTNDVVFGCTVSGRPTDLPGVETMVGLFLNTVPVRLRFDAHERAVDCLVRHQAVQTEASMYDHTPLTDIRRWCGRPGDQSLFESVFIFENYPTSVFESGYGRAVVPAAASRAALRVREVTAVEQVHYPLVLTLTAADVVGAKLTYDVERFTRHDMRRVLGHLGALATALLRDPQARIGALPLLDAADRHRLNLWNHTHRHRAEAPHTLPQAIEAQAARTPDATALVFENQHLSYEALNASANALASDLYGRGVRADMRVAVCLERNLELPTALLAILKAGGAYVPLDPVYPPERLRGMLEDTDAAVLITSESLGRSWNTGPDHQTILLDHREPPCSPREGDARRDPHHAENIGLPIDPDQLAYVIYTSGSTGRPKGAMNTHAAIVNRLLWMQEAYGLDDTDRVLQKTPFSFDVSVWEFFWPLLAGATVIIARPGGHRDPAYLVETLAREQVTTLHFVPSMLPPFLAEPALDSCTSVRRIICSGEELPPRLAKALLERLPANVHNLYGPTEAAVDVSFHQCTREEHVRRVPIGRPIANTQLEVLDEEGQAAPIGFAGELCIGGIALGRGYLNAPGLTAERFVPSPDPDPPGARVYRTGDLARWTNEGELEFLGRLDAQIKLRGFRVEPGEIEARLAAHPTVGRCAVTLARAANGDPTLVGYVVPAPGTVLDDRSLKASLRAHLPDYMIPSTFVALPALPITISGKLDRGALPAPPLPAVGVRRRGPRDSIETGLKQLWEELLNVPDVSIDASFFDLGGHSISALALVTRIATLFGASLAIHQIFEHPTVEEMATLIRQGAGKQSPILMPLKRRGSRPPLYCVHPGGGLVHSYVTLARYVGPDQPLYAFQSRGLEEGETPLDSIESMARLYVDAMRRHRPDGPYHIAGLSMGASVAYEMAQQLWRADQPVALVVLLDGAYDPNPDGHEDLDEEAYIAQWESWYAVKTAVEELHIPRAEIEGLDRDITIARYLAHAKAADVVPQDVTFDQIRRFFRVFALNDRALRRYRPEPHPGPVCLIRSDKPHDLDDSFGWGALVQGGLTIHEIPGRHGHFVHEPGVAALATLLGALVEKTRHGPVITKR